MRVILDREDIEEAIVKYIKDKVLPYGDTRKINVVQERRVSAKVTFNEDIAELTEPLPGFSDDVMPEGAVLHTDPVEMTEDVVEEAMAKPDPVKDPFKI